MTGSTKRKTPKDYHKLAKSRSFKWLGPEVPNAKTKTWWQCTCGNRFETSYGIIRMGCDCPRCGIEKVAAQRRNTPEDYYNLAKKRGFKWLGPEVPNSHAKTWWRCEKGHEWETAYANIRNGHGCQYCAKTTPEDYHVLAQERGLRWLGPEVPSVVIKTWWICEQGHRRKSSYADVQKSKGCPKCALDQSRLKPNDYHTLAKMRGFKWLGDEVFNNRTKTIWQCFEGHKWEARYSDIQKGAGCPDCKSIEHAKRRRKKPEAYLKLAKRREFEWLGPEVFNNRTKTQWQCDKGHKWYARYDDIRNGSGCPECADMVNGTRVSNPQKALCDLLSGKLNYSVGRFWVDIALDINNTRIAVEYDSWYWHAGREEADAAKDDFLFSKGWRVLRIKSNTLLPTRPQIYKAISKLLSGMGYVEITLEDWGVGPTKFNSDCENDTKLI